LKQIILKYSGLLALISSTFISTQTYAAACADGANALGCTISTTDITYTLTGNIIPASNGIGIEFNTGAARNNLTITGNITTTGVSAYGLLLYKSDNNTTNLTGNINTEGVPASGLYFFDSDNNTTNLTGNITTAGDNSRGLLLRDSDRNTITINGNIITSGTDGDSEPILVENSNSNTFTLSGAVHSLGGDQAITVNAGVGRTSQNNTFSFSEGASVIGGFNNAGTNTILTNQGTIDSITNSGSIATFNNAQTGATYSGTLPVNYNIIINSPTEYGSTTFSSATGTTTFGLDTVNLYQEVIMLIYSTG